MPAPRDAAIVERARILVTTTLRTHGDIAREVGICTRTLQVWISKYNWTRPAGAPVRRRKITPQNEAAVRRLYESGAAALDIAILVKCHASYVNHYARLHGWKRPVHARKAEPLGEDIAEIASALRDPASTRGDLVALIERAVALAVADAITSGDPRCERQAVALGRYAAIVKTLPERRAASAREDSDADCDDDFPDANELIEEIARRFEEFCAADDAGAFSSRPAEPPA